MKQFQLLLPSTISSSSSYCEFLALRSRFLWVQLIGTIWGLILLPGYTPSSCNPKYSTEGGQKEMIWALVPKTLIGHFSRVRFIKSYLNEFEKLWVFVYWLLNTLDLNFWTIYVAQRCDFPLIFSFVKSTLDTISICLKTSWHQGCQVILSDGKWAYYDLRNDHH